MKLMSYVCSHCGRRFEAEEKENIECPGCYWSSSVKKEEEVAGEELKQDLFVGSGKKASGALEKVKLFFMVCLIGGLVAAIGFFGWPLAQSFLSSNESPLPFGKSKEEIAGPAGLKKDAVPATDPNQITEEEKSILNRRVELAADRKPSSEEQKVLDYHASFQTGLVEKLPSQAWTLEDFKKLIAEQERAYQVPLPGSYKRKLDQLVKEKYLPAQAAFEQGNLQVARDLWAGSLAFPIYANDVKKHRGVILTMLRPFINDTLSKIGAINNTLVEGKIREKERIITEEYQSLFPLLQSYSWKEALALIQKMESGLRELENPAQEAAAPPPYPPQDIALVDEGIRATLVDLLTPPPQGFADFEPLHQDILAKKNVVLGFLPESLEKSRRYYEAGLERIAKGEWSQAQVELRQIDIPLELLKDAQEKIKILEKLRKAELDSVPKSG